MKMVFPRRRSYQPNSKASLVSSIIFPEEKDIFHKLVQCLTKPQLMTFSQVLNSKFTRYKKITPGHYTRYYKNKARSTYRIVELRCQSNPSVMCELQIIYDEVKIIRALRSLRKGIRNKNKLFCCANKIWLVWDSWPELLEAESTEYPYQKGFYAVFKMKDAGEPIEQLIYTRMFKLHHLVSLCRQISLGLSHAEYKLEFEHRGIHPDCLMMVPTSKQHVTLVWDGNVTRIPSYGYRALLTNFSLARARVGHRLYFTELAGADDDYRVRLTGRLWSQFQPVTNAVGLALALKFFIDKIPNAERHIYNLFNLRRSDFEQFTSARDLYMAFSQQPGL